MEGTGQPGSREWPWGQFLRAAPGISKLLSVFYKSTHRFDKSSFFIFLSLQRVWGWHGSWGHDEDIAVSICTCLLYIGYFSVLGSIHRPCVLLCSILIAGRYHFKPFRCLGVFPRLAGSTKDLLQRRCFERSQYSPNWSWVVHGSLKLTVKHAILWACAPYQSHLR